MASNLAQNMEAEFLRFRRRWSVVVGDDVINGKCVACSGS